MTKLATKNDLKLARKTAYNLIFSADYIIMGRNPINRLDMRYKFDKLCKEMIADILPSINRQDVLRKKRMRKIANTIDVNNVHNFWKNRPFYVDILHNKSIKIASSYIQDGQRHHHCKNYVDFKILDAIRLMRQKAN